MKSQDFVIAEADRVPAPCPYFGQGSNKCGGCSLQHVREEAYRALKIESVKTPLARTGIRVGEFAAPVFLPAATRRRTSVAAIKASGRVIFGYNEAQSHKIVNIERCLVLEPELDKKIQALRPYLSRLLPDNKTCDIMLQQVDNAYDMVLTGPFVFGYEQHEALAELASTLGIARISHREKETQTPEIMLARQPVIKTFGALKTELPPASFLQASSAGEKALSEIVVKYAGSAQTIADLFSGCGTFTGALLPRVAYAADGDAAAIAALAKAAPSLKAGKRNLFKNPLTVKELNQFDAVIFDPPRAGALAQAAQLAESSVPIIIAVSCNPATFARDAKLLQDGGYTLKSVTIVDQFVWSAHVELAGFFAAGA